MPLSELDFSTRADVTELMDEPCSPEELRACLRDIARLNRWFMAYRPTLCWLVSLDLQKFATPTHILDVGCGYGDTLRQIEKWASTRQIRVKLTGCDLNRDAVAIAAEASSNKSRIEWVAADVFQYQSGEPIDIIVSSLFTHHLAEWDIVQFIRWMEERARVGWFINDLSRAAVPYHLLNAFSKVAGLHRFVQNDGPVSIKRAFVPADWLRICARAGLRENEINIETFTPARLCVGRKMQRQ